MTAILEPNQALIRAHLTELSPIRTRLVTADYSIGPLQFGIFRKWITNKPIVSPDYRQVYTENQDISPEFPQHVIPGPRRLPWPLDRPHARAIPVLPAVPSHFVCALEAARTEHGITYPHELDSRHRVLTEIDCRASSKVSLGMQLQIRTGYPYSPLRKMSFYYRAENVQRSLSEIGVVE